MGDSDGPPGSFEALDDDIRCAIDTLCDRTGVKRVVLWGLCDGATAALTYAPADARVAGVVAANPWVRSPSLQAEVRLKSYYVQRLGSRDFWSRLATGRISQASLVDAGTAVRSQLGSARAGTPAFVERFERAWDRFEGDLLFVVSGRDHTAEEFLTWVEADAARCKRLERVSTTVDYLQQADHTFSSVEAALAVQDCTVRWLRSRNS
jgi:exosortase A-associated hydrolase 1